MRIKRILSQYRRDFTALYECEHCGAESDGPGYDDDNFHRNVIPEMVCANCRQTASVSYEPRATKYAPHEIV